MDKLYIDVREADEFKNSHIKDSVNIPLSVIQSSLSTIKKLASSFKVVLICQSGVRATQAKSFVGDDSVSVFEGGLNKWEQKEELVSSTQRQSLSIMRQVMIVAGLMVLCGGLGSLYVNGALVWLTVFVGAGLTFAGVSGICFMAKLLAVMPWNK